MKFGTFCLFSLMTVASFCRCSLEPPSVPSAVESSVRKIARNPVVFGARQPEAPEIVGDRFRASLQSDPTPNNYRVSLNWHLVSTPAEAWVIQREDTATGLKHLATLEKTTKEYLDRSVKPGETYVYLLSPLEGAEPAPIERVEITLPRDLVIDGERSLQEIKGFRRLYLPTGSKILTAGENLDIEVTEIVAQGGSIETFPAPEITAPLARDGKAGGTITIRAKRGSGALPIRGFGQNGGPGFPGSPGRNGTAGKPGTNGTAAVRMFLGAIDRMQRIIEGKEKDPSAWYCVLRPTDGEPGENAGPGGWGGNGGRGGDSARVFVEIRNPAGFQVQPALIPGAGGFPGKGGSGGLGGAGGPPGAVDVNRACEPAAPGKPGFDGIDGKPGEAGKEGLSRSACLRLGDAEFGNCAEFVFSGGRVR